MKIALHLARDQSGTGRLVGRTYVWGYDTDTHEGFEVCEDLPHMVHVFERTPKSEALIGRRLETLEARVTDWAERLEPRDEESAARLTRFLTNPSAYFSLETDETPNRIRYTLTIPNLTRRQIETLNLPLVTASSNETARMLIPPYSVLEPCGERGAYHRESRPVRMLTAHEIMQLPTMTSDLEVMNWQPVLIEGLEREALLARIEEDAERAGLSYEAKHYEHMDDGLLRKHARHLANLIRDEHIYDIPLRTPNGAYIDLTTLPARSDTLRTPFADAYIIRAHRDELGYELERIIREHRPSRLAGHNFISYDIPQIKTLGLDLRIGADGEGIKTRFAVPGSTIETRRLPDGREDTETHQSFITDRGWRGIDVVDPRPWLGYVDELMNTKLDTVTRALTGEDVRKSLNHGELEAIAQAVHHPDRADDILSAAGLEGSIEEMVELERMYALEDVWMSTKNAERITPTVASLALALRTTLSGICTTSPEQHARRAWDEHGRGERTTKMIADARYKTMNDRHRFTGEKAFEKLTDASRQNGSHDVILARRTAGRRAAHHIEHPTLTSLIQQFESNEGFDRSWIQCYIDAMLTEPLYALLASGSSELERDANAWMLGLDRSHLEGLETVFTSIPHMRTVASSPKHLYFPVREAAHVEALASEGWVEPLEEGHAIVFGHSVIYSGSRQMRSGYADPSSKQGLRTDFTKRWLPRIIGHTLERDYEGAFRTIRDAYEAFTEDDAIIEKTLGKDADDYNAKTAIIEEAKRIDARKGDTVFVRMPLEAYRDSLFGLSGSGLFIDPLFAALGGTGDRALTFGYTRFLNGDDNALRTLIPTTRATPLLL